MKFLVLLFIVGFAASATVPDFRSSERIDVDQTADQLKKQLNGLVDIAIGILEKTPFLPPSLITEVVVTVSKLREKGLNAIDLVLEKIKNADISKIVKNRVKYFLDRIKNLFNSPVQKVDTDEVTQKIKDQFNLLVDKVIETVKNNKFISPALIAEIVEVINKLRDRHVNFIDLVNERVKNLQGIVKERIQKLIDFIKKFFDKEETSMPIQRVDTDEVTQKIIDKFNDLVDKVINLVENNKIVSPAVIVEAVRLINQLREHNVNALNIVNQRIKDLKGKVKEHVQKVIDFIKNWFDINDSVSFADENEDEEKIKEKIDDLKTKIENVLDKIIESTKDSWFPPLRYLGELRDLMNEIKKFNVNMEDIIRDRMNQIGGLTREFICKIMTTIFNLKDSPLCKQ